MTAMRRKQIKILISLGWLALGLGIGSGGTVVLHQWASTSAPIAEARPEQQQRPEAALTTELLLTGEPALGSGKAPLTIVEFSDFECPYCRQFHEEVLSLKRDYIDTGLVRFIHKDLPLHSTSRPGLLLLPLRWRTEPLLDLYDALFDQQTCLECKGVLGIAEAINPTHQHFGPACNGRQPKLSSQPIFLKPTYTTSAPRRPSSSDPAALTRNTTATLSQGRCPGLNSKP